MTLPLMFALAFPIEAPPAEGVFAVEIPAEAYATLTTADLRDLAVVDAQGRPQSISLQRPAPRRAEAPTTIPLPPPMALPKAPPPATGRLDLQVSQDTAGRIAHLQLSTVDGGTPAIGEDWLLDLKPAAREGYDGLRIVPAADGADFRVLVDVRGSDDLVTWTTLAEALPLLRVSDGSRTIERLDLRFPRTSLRHLALAPASGSGPLPTVDGVAALRQGDWQPPAERVLTLSAMAGAAPAERFDYPAVGPLPVTRVAVQVAEANAIHEFTLVQRDGESDRVLLAGTAWRFDVDGRILRSPEQDVGLPGWGSLRVDLRQPAMAPRLELHYTPEQVVVVASGQPPFRLLAGSGGFRNDPVPMEQALAGLRAVRGQDWTPPLARLGAAQTAAGLAALESPRRADPGRLALWAVLGLGALLVGGLAWRLLREPAQTA